MDNDTKNETFKIQIEPRVEFVPNVPDIEITYALNHADHHMDPNDPRMVPSVEEEVSLGMYCIEDAVNPETCAQMIEWLESGKAYREWDRSKTGTGTGEVSERRTSDSTTFPFLSYRMPDFCREINKAVHDWVTAYAIEWNTKIVGSEDPSVQKYGVGEEYKVHYDNGPGMERNISALLYLNDDFEGGQTHFPYVQSTIYPKVGKIAIFPSNFIYAHAALPVTKGTKYAAAYWFRGA